MGDFNFLTELGFGLSALALIWVVVRYFIEAITKKDEYIATIVQGFQKQVSDFNTTINNHIDHQTAAANKETAALNALTKAVTALTKEIKREK